MINLDKLFENWFKKWMEDNKDNYEDVNEIEEQIHQLYHQFIEEYNDELGCAPSHYYDNITNPQELINELILESEGDNNPNEILLDKIVDTKECAQSLYNLILKEKNNTKLIMLSINLLQELGGIHPLSDYANWIVSDGVDEEIKELVVEILTDHANEVQEQLYTLLDSATDKEKGMIADILVNAPKNDKTYNLLIGLFNKKDNIPYYAGLLGKYGDERAARTLYQALDNCNYLEFIEIKNAIERMGGMVDDEYRDFSDDEYYKAIKHLK